MLPFVRTTLPHQAEDDLDEESTYFWIDAFSLNQHAIPTRTLDAVWMTAILPDFVKECGAAIVVLNPWSK